MSLMLFYSTVIGGNNQIYFGQNFFFLDLLKEVESRLLSKSQVSDSMSKQTRLLTKLPPKEDKIKNNMSKGKEPISPKTPMQS